MVPPVPQFGSWVASPTATARDPLARASDSVSIARAASLVAGLLAPVYQSHNTEHKTREGTKQNTGMKV